jgi:hypothetical protein
MAQVFDLTTVAAMPQSAALRRPLLPTLFNLRKGLTPFLHSRIFSDKPETTLPATGFRNSAL